MTKASWRDCGHATSARVGVVAATATIRGLGCDPAGAIPEGIEAQTEQALTNLAGVLEAAGASMDDVVKTTIFYTDVEDFGRLNEVYARHMPDPPPARSASANVRLTRGIVVLPT